MSNLYCAQCSISVVYLCVGSNSGEMRLVRAEFKVWIIDTDLRPRYKLPFEIEWTCMVLGVNQLKRLLLFQW